MTRYFILPGLGNSGPTYWQTYFEESKPQFKRVQQQSWTEPVCADWIASRFQKIPVGYGEREG